ncbi:MAG: methyltransferase domain-containing protein [Ilumatobacter sp.]|nr:methyltransferase domain-containing protein [Ilumatobacter sp.]
MPSGVASELMDLAGGDSFADVRRESDDHQQSHGCGLHSASGPQMQLVAALARSANATRALDLGSGLGYSTLWMASAVGPRGAVVGIDDCAEHTRRASAIAQSIGYADRVSYLTGSVADVLPTLDGPFDMIHDDAWFAKTPDHLDAMIALLRPGGLLTMANWFLLVDALTGEPRNDWNAFAGPCWADDTLEYARLLAGRTDLSVVWVENPPIGFATIRQRPDDR